MSSYHEIERGRPAWRPFFLKAVLALPMAVLLLGAPSAAQAAMRGYIVTSFDTIRVEAPVRINLATGSGVSASGEGDRALLDLVDLSVSGRVLTVKLQQGPDIGFERDGSIAPPVITLSTDRLKRAQILGGGVLHIASVDGIDVDLSMSGNGEIIVDDADVERLSLYVGGGGRLTVAGRARSVQASVNGPGAIEAAGLVANNASIANDGVGSVRISVNGPASVTASGSGNTVVEGKPVCTINRRGSGMIICNKQ